MNILRLFLMLALVCCSLQNTQPAKGTEASKIAEEIPSEMQFFKPESLEKFPDIGKRVGYFSWPTDQERIAFTFGWRHICCRGFISNFAGSVFQIEEKTDLSSCTFASPFSTTWFSGIKGDYKILDYCRSLGSLVLSYFEITLESLSLLAVFVRSLTKNSSQVK